MIICKISFTQTEKQTLKFKIKSTLKSRWEGMPIATLSKMYLYAKER